MSQTATPAKDRRRGCVRSIRSEASSPCSEDLPPTGEAAGELWGVIFTNLTIARFPDQPRRTNLFGRLLGQLLVTAGCLPLIWGCRRGNAQDFPFGSEKTR